MSSSSSPPYSYTLTLIIIGIGSAMGLWYLALRTLIPIDTITLVIVLCALLSFGTHYLLMRRIRAMHVLPQVGLHLMGYGLTGAAIFLALNFFLHGARTEKVIGLKSEIREAEEHSYLDVSSTDPEFKAYPYIISDNAENLEDFPESVTLGMAEGIFGYKIVVNKSYRFRQQRQQ